MSDCPEPTRSGFPTPPVPGITEIGWTLVKSVGQISNGRGHREPPAGGTSRNELDLSYPVGRLAAHRCDSINCCQR